MTNGTVFLIPGNAASSLADVGESGNPVQPIWLDPLALAAGKFARLALPPAPGVQVVPTGVLPVYYGLLEHAIRKAEFHVYPFAYDWRLDIDKTAMQLRDTILATKPPISIVAHSMGGQVARRAIQFLRDKIGQDAALSMLGRLVLLGPANSGTLAAALALGGSINSLPAPFDILPDMPPYVQPVIKTFMSLYQLLPWNLNLLPSLADGDHNVRSFGFWDGAIDAEMLSAAMNQPPSGQPWGATVDTTFFERRTAIILGDAPRTCGGVIYRFFSTGRRLVVDDQYNVAGDGFVPRLCSLLPRVATYIDGGVNHLQLPISSSVIQSVVTILQGQLPAIGRYA